MKGIYYAIRHLVRRKRDSLVKVFALTSGIVAGMVLVAKIAFDLSYDRWIPGVENLYRIQSLYTTHVGTAEENTLDYSHTLQPVAPTAAAEIPGVEAGTSIYEAGERVVFISGERYEVKAIYADTSFFSTMRLPVLSGDMNSLGVKGNVFLILVFVSLSFILLYAGKDIIESLTGVPLRNLFSYGQLTGYALASLLVIAIAGLIPAKIFSSVPAMDIFRRGARDRNMWKHVLLFIQVACSAAITGFLVIAVSQYRFMTGKDMGYDAGQLAYCSFDRVEQSGRQMIKDRLMQVPGIEGVTFSENIPTRKFYGMQLVDPGSGETVATCRYTFVDTDFIRTLGIALTEGSDIPGEMSDPSPALVNRRLTDALGWGGSPTGRVLPQNGIVVSGVIGDFTMQSIFLEQDPVCLLPLPEGFRRLPHSCC